MLGITAGARKKGKLRIRWMDDIKSVTGLSVNDFSERQEKVEIISEQHSQEDSPEVLQTRRNSSSVFALSQCMIMPDYVWLKLKQPE
jgi:hypothetical protein